VNMKPPVNFFSADISTDLSFLPNKATTPSYLDLG